MDTAIPRTTELPAAMTAPTFDTRNTAERTIIEMESIVDSSWKVLGHYRYKSARPPSNSVACERTMVVALCVSGVQPFTVGEEQFVMTGGQGIVIPPGNVYGTDSFPEQKGELLWLLLDLEHEREFSLPGFSLEEASAWRDLMLKKEKKLMFRFEPETLAEARRIFSCWEKKGAKSSPCSTVELRARLSLLLVHLFEDRCSSDSVHFSGPTSEVMKWIEQRVEGEMCSVAEMAEVAGVSVSRFQARFKEDTGVSPADYLVRRKLLESQRMLEEGMSVTEVAMSLGFSSSQYFATVFKRYTMKSPSLWLESL